MKVDKLKKLLESTTVSWVCPVSGKIFDINDTTSIELHKENLLKKAEQKEAASKLLIEVKKLMKDVEKINNLSDLSSFIGTCQNNLFNNQFPQLKLSPVKLNTKEKAEMKKNWLPITQNIFLKAENINKSTQKTYEKIFNGKFVNQFLVIPKIMNKSPLFNRIHDWQSAPSQSNVKKVDMDQRLILDNIPDYQELKAKLKESNTKLHDLKIEVKSLEKSIHEHNFQVIEFVDTKIKKKRF